MAKASKMSIRHFHKTEGTIPRNIFNHYPEKTEEPPIQDNSNDRNQPLPLVMQGNKPYKIRKVEKYNHTHGTHLNIHKITSNIPF